MIPNYDILKGKKKEESLTVQFVLRPIALIHKTMCANPLHSSYHSETMLLAVKKRNDCYRSNW